jgi:hypothetical protein
VKPPPATELVTLPLGTVLVEKWSDEKLGRSSGKGVNLVELPLSEEPGSAEGDVAVGWRFHCSADPWKKEACLYALFRLAAGTQHESAGLAVSCIELQTQPGRLDVAKISMPAAEFAANVDHCLRCSPGLLPFGSTLGFVAIEPGNFCR